MAMIEKRTVREIILKYIDRRAERLVMIDDTFGIGASGGDVALKRMEIQNEISMLKRIIKEVEATDQEMTDGHALRKHIQRLEKVKVKVKEEANAEMELMRGRLSKSCAEFERKKTEPENHEILLKEVERQMKAARNIEHLERIQRKATEQMTSGSHDYCGGEDGRT